MKKILLSIVLNCSLTSCLFAQYGGVVVQPIVGGNTTVGFASNAVVGGNIIYQRLGTLTAVTNTTYYYETNVQGSITFIQTTPSSAWSILTNGTWKYAVTNTALSLVYYTNSNDATNVICNDASNGQGFGYWTILDNTNDTSFVTIYFFIGSPAITNTWVDGVDLLTPTNFLAYNGLLTQTNNEPYFNGNMKGGYLFGVTNFLLNPYQYDNASKFAWGLWTSNQTGRGLVPLVTLSQEAATPDLSGTITSWGGQFSPFNSIVHQQYLAGRFFGASLVWFTNNPLTDNRVGILKFGAYSNRTAGGTAIFEVRAQANSPGSHGIYNNPWYVSSKGLMAVGNLTDAADASTDNLETNLIAWLNIIPSGSKWSGSTSAVPAIAIFPQTNLVVVPSNSIEYDGNNLYLDSSNNVRFALLGSITPTINARIPTAVTVGASAFTFSNATPSVLECYISDTAAFSITKNGAAIYSSVTSDAYILLQPTNSIAITYASTTPTLKTNAW